MKEKPKRKRSLIQRNTQEVLAGILSELDKINRTPEEKDEFIKVCGMLLNLPEEIVSDLAKGPTKPAVVQPLCKGLLGKQSFEVVKFLSDQVCKAEREISIHSKTE